ncbi:MAG: DUF3999 family protein [Chitinivibrionales bacterium]|nr:DUF3999 family protein [Chitinivibrionales bacterium]
MRRVVAPAILLALYGHALCAGPGDFPYRAPLVPAESTTHTIGAARTQRHVYAATADGFANLRIFDSDSGEVPYHVRVVRTTDTVPQEVAVHLDQAAFRTLDNNRIAITFKREKKDSIPEALVIRTGNTNFEKSVRVYGSDNRRNWTPLGPAEPIFDYTRFVDVRNTKVRFPARAYRYYEVRIDNVTEIKRSPFTRIVRGMTGDVSAQYESFTQRQDQLRIDRIDFYRTVSRIVSGESQNSEHALDIADRTVDREQKKTFLIVHGERIPVSRLILDVNTTNFSRDVLIEGTNDTAWAKGWQWVAREHVHQVEIGDFRRKDITLPLRGPRRYQYYRLTIDDQDNPPIEVAGVRGYGPVYELLFFHRGADSLAIYYGGDIAAPHYDVGSVLAQVPAVECDIWTIGEHELTGAAPQRALPTRVLLVIAILLMVAVLAYLITSMTIRLQQGSGER